MDLLVRRDESLVVTVVRLEVSSAETMVPQVLLKGYCRREQWDTLLLMQAMIQLKMPVEKVRFAGLIWLFKSWN